MAESCRTSDVASNLPSAGLFPDDPAVLRGPKTPRPRPNVLSRAQPLWWSGSWLVPRWCPSGSDPLFQRSTPGPSLGGLLRPRAGALVRGTGEGASEVTAGFGDKERGIRRNDRYKQDELKENTL